MKTISYEIVTEQYPSNPRDEFDNLSTFYGPKNSHYLIGGKHDVKVYDVEETIKEFRKEKAIIIEFESPAGTCCAVVERSQLEKEYLSYGYSMRKALYHARQCAKSEVEMWLAYIDGEVYGFLVKDDKGNTLDSCWGFYSYNDCKAEAQDLVKYYEEKFDKEEQELERRIEVAATL